MTWQGMEQLQEEEEEKRCSAVKVSGSDATSAHCRHYVQGHVSCSTGPVLRKVSTFIYATTYD